MIPSVVIVSGDPGGANAVAPVLQKLLFEGKVKVHAFAYREARKLWKEKGIPFVELPDTTTKESAKTLLREHGADLYFSGTSYNDQEFEKQFVAAARDLIIPSLIIIDYPSNYSIRFSDNAGNRIYLPDKIAIMDKHAFGEMVEEGFDPSLLVITGQPAYDDLIIERDSFSAKDRARERTNLGAQGDELVVVFASEPLFWGTPDNPADCGYTMTGVLHALITALDTIQEKSRRKILLVIRPHPREDPREFQDIKGEKIRVIVSSTGRSRDIIQSADLVCGMTTALLIEACYLGCVVASIQPGLSGLDILPSNRLGYSTPIYKEEDIIPVLQTLLLDQKERDNIRTQCRSLNADFQAQDRVVRQIYSMCGIN
jgi:hypothetical protein